MNRDLETDPFADARRDMVKRQLQKRGIRDERVLQAFLRVPRHEFVPAELARQAYSDNPLPIGFDQTISQPYIVAAMLESLALQAEEVVLEIGTGSGYMTALIAELAAMVYSIERYAGLASAARERLERLGYRNVKVVVGDGSLGLPDAAPYDAIAASAAAPGVPSALVQQLREGGRMVLPVGPADSQDLVLVSKNDGQIVVRRLEGCRFVPLVGEQGFPQY